MDLTAAESGAHSEDEDTIHDCINPLCYLCNPDGNDCPKPADTNTNSQQQASLKSDEILEREKTTTNQKKNDVYFKIWNRLEARARTSSYVENIKEKKAGDGVEHPPEILKKDEKDEKSTELDKYVAEYSKQPDPSKLKDVSTEKDSDKVPKTQKQRVFSKNLKKAGQASADAVVTNVEELPDPKDDLERLAMEELLKEAKRGAERSETMGPSGWLKRTMKPNKKFLQNTLMSTLSKPFSSRERKHYENHQERMNYGFKGSHWRKEDRRERSEQDSVSDKTKDGLVKHDFYYYYLPEEEVQKKLERKKKLSRNTTSAENVSKSNLSESDLLSNEKYQSKRKHQSEDKNDSKHKKRKKKKRHSSIDKYSDHSNYRDSDCSAASYKQHKHKKRKKHKKDRKRSETKSKGSEYISESDDYSHKDRSSSRSYEHSSSHYHSHRKETRHSSHKKKKKRHTSVTPPELDGGSLDSWDASNYAQGWKSKSKPY